MLINVNICTGVLTFYFFGLQVYTFMTFKLTATCHYVCYTSLYLCCDRKRCVPVVCLTVLDARSRVFENDWQHANVSWRTVSVEMPAVGWTLLLFELFHIYVAISHEASNHISFCPVKTKIAATTGNQTVKSVEMYIFC